MAIKLILSDIDGTLIPYGEKGLPQELFPLIRALREKGILFCPQIADALTGNQHLAAIQSINRLAERKNLLPRLHRRLGQQRSFLLPSRSNHNRAVFTEISNLIRHRRK